MKEPTGWKKLGICAKQLARAAHNPIGVAVASEKNLMLQHLKLLKAIFRQNQFCAISIFTFDKTAG